MHPKIEHAQNTCVATIGTALKKLDEAARHINVYRAASFQAYRLSNEGVRLQYMMQMRNAQLNDFDTYDQDKERPDWARKLQLASLADSTAKGLDGILQHATAKPIRNPALLHELYRTRMALFGDKTPQESLSYARRAARKLHDDFTHDLYGYQTPSSIMWPKQRSTDYQHALVGARGLFLLHSSLKHIVADPHYQKALWARTTAKGGRLTVGQLAIDLAGLTLVSVAVGLLRRKPIAVILKCSTGAYVVLAAVFIGQLLAARRRARMQVSCRDLVLYTGAANNTGAAA